MAHPLAGKPAPVELLVNVPRLVSAYYLNKPDPHEPSQRVSFGTSGHRGSSFSRSFNEAHILAVAQAVADYRDGRGFTGPLYMGADTHALSEPAFATALEVFAANSVTVMIQTSLEPVPTPLVSRAILAYNADKATALADGVVITPSHNPPEHGGFKYNPPHGGPADADVTRWIEKRANQLMEGGNKAVKRIPYERALLMDTTVEFDFIGPYVKGLRHVLEMETIKSAGLRLGVDPLGGSSIKTWEAVADVYGLNLKVVNPRTDPTFSFMPVDRDGVIRMDCSSPFAMAGLIEHRADFDLALGNDPDADRHGIVTRAGGLMNPNHYLSVAIEYLFRHRQGWPGEAQVGKTLVSSAMIDRVAADVGRKVSEVPVGFKWFVEGLLSSDYGFGGEESAGASFLQKDGSVWTTDKDGVLLCLLAAEIMAVTGKDPHDHYELLAQRFGRPLYERLQAPADRRQKDILKNLSPDNVTADTLAGEPITAVLTRAPGNDEPIGGLKVAAQSGWFAARPSGTEEIYKIYTESFKGEDHLRAIQQEAKEMVTAAFKAK